MTKVKHRYLAVNPILDSEQVWNYSNEYTLLPCPIDGGKPRLVNTHVACSNPRCAMWKAYISCTQWNTRFDGVSISGRALQTWDEKDEG